VAAAAEWDAARAVDSAPSRSFHGSVWRVHWRGVEATDWHLSLRTSGRYHRALDLFPPAQTWPALYTSMRPEIAIWEMVRRSAARNLSYLANNVLSELEVKLANVLDVSDASVVGLATSDLTGRDYTRCRDLATATLARGFEALIVPSAALPGSNLVILPRNLRSTSTLRLVRGVDLPLDEIALSPPGTSPS
jgi:RES domain-containing protein